MTDSRRLIDKLWSYCGVLRDDGVGVVEYTGQLTYRAVPEDAARARYRKLRPEQIVPEEYSWQKLLDAQGDQILARLGRRGHECVLLFDHNTATTRAQLPPTAAALTRLTG